MSITSCLRPTIVRTISDPQVLHFTLGAIEVLEDQMDIEAPELGIRLILSEGLSVCTPLQRERIQKYYIEGMSLSEIAEGKNISTVQQSIDAGIKKMKIFFGVDP